VANKSNEGDYTDEELISVQRVHPMFLCPNCNGRNWDSTTTFQTPYKARLWRGKTVCKTCKEPVMWLIDPDRTIEFQTAKMHRPIGY
jgi:transcription elongation factor Elf1